MVTASIMLDQCSHNILPGGCVQRVYIMKAIEAARAVLLASQPDPNSENAITPIAAQPIWAMNMLYFCKFIIGKHAIIMSYLTKQD